MTEPIELSYALFLLPASHVAFRRWRWELWHGTLLLASGWRLNALHAQRAVRVHALRYVHRLHGLHALRPEAGQPAEVAWDGEPVAVASGDLRVVLMPLPVTDVWERPLPASA